MNKERCGAVRENSEFLVVVFLGVHNCKLPIIPINPMRDILIRKSLKMVGPFGEDLTSSGGKQSKSEPAKIWSESDNLTNLLTCK